MNIITFILIVFSGTIVYLLKRFVDSFSQDKKYAIIDHMIAREDYLAAIKYLEDLKKVSPNNYEIYEYLAVLYEEKKMYVRAVKCYEKLLELNHPDNEHNILVISRRLSRIYNELGLIDKYYIENKKVIEIDPNDSEALFELGYFLAGCGSYDKSLDYFEKIVKLNPDNEKALFYLGLTYLSKKWFKEGRDCMEKVIMKNPDNGEAHYYLGFIQKEYKMPEAIKTFEDALKTLKDEDYRNKCSLAAAVTSIEQNMIDMAVNLLNNAISKIDMDNPFRRDFLYNLGWAYFFKGDIEAALSNWDEVSSIDMNYENITEIVNSNVNSNFEEMERIYGIYASNITYPTAREYIGLKKEYDIDELDQHLGLWKQKMISLAKSRGVYIGPVKSAKVFSTLTKLKFKNMSHKIVTSLGYVIETEKIYKDGVDFETYKRSAKKSEKIYFRIRNWNDVVTEENVGMLAKDVKETGIKFATVILASCGKYTKKAKENAEKYNIRLYDSKLLDNILKKINDKE